MIKIKIPKTKAIDEWMCKEWGSYEDSKKDPNHPCAFLKLAGQTVEINNDQLNRLILSGYYQSTAWNEDEIVGGERTMRAISNFVNKLKQLSK